ncbi:glycosyltransferase [Salinibacterium amurskyense]|uniref:glycosyltransferase n=1 Tax=Salinibacterium amurskyense TaxID=205941 RepID=UPI00311DFEE4
MAPLRILCISFSPIERDARVLRQLGVLAEFGDVTTVGYGSQPDDAAAHVEIPAGLASLPQTVGGVALLALRQWSRAELAAPAVQFALKALRGQQFDVIVANDARAIPAAHALAQGAPVWADLHEWAPEERTHVLSWRLLVAPLMRHICATYLTRSAAVSTVCDSIAGLYERDYHVRPDVVRNSTHWRDLAPSVADPTTIRMVHSGAAIHGRNLEAMIDATRELGEGYSLDLYLVAGGDGGAYLRKLQARAGGLASIRFNPPVTPAELPGVLNKFDIGVFWIPPTHTNARYTLPNKFFDYVQARLAIAVGPSIEMQQLVDSKDLGVVSSGFDVAECVASIRSLTAADIAATKSRVDAASRELSFEHDGEVMRSIVRRVAATDSAAQ